jgi:selenocysteine lyase/cysteine desulfurase
MIEPLMRGGTGSQSELEQQPEHLPDKYESGTPNISGIAGLHAGIGWLNERGIREIREREKELVKLLIEGLSVIPKVKIYGPKDPKESVAIVSFTADGKTVSEIGSRLDDEHGILSRVGLHCAPSAHRTIGSFPEGTVRLAPGVFSTREDIQKTLEAISEVCH